MDARQEKRDQAGRKQNVPFDAVRPLSIPQPSDEHRKVAPQPRAAVIPGGQDIDDDATTSQGSHTSSNERPSGRSVGRGV